MIGLELLVPHTGSAVVVEHLAAVQTQAHRDLRRAPEHLDHLSRILDTWAAAAIDNQALLDRAGPELALAQFAQPLPPPSATRTHAANAPGIVADLRTHGWLRPVGMSIAVGRPWRAEIGAPFGVTR